MRKSGLVFSNQTVREIVHLSLGGPAIRVRFSNAFGGRPLEIGAAHVALRASGSAIQASTDRALTFGGARGIWIPPNAVVASDPVALGVPPGSDVAISIFFPHEAGGAGIHYLAQQTSYVGDGDATGAASMERAREIHSWVFLAGVDVSGTPGASAIAFFGDSRIDGDGSTPNANHRWPDFLAKRLAERGLPRGVVNAGIIGNRILHDAPAGAVELGVSGLARFDRDVLDVPGVKYVVVLEGIVDIGLPGTEYAPGSEAVSVEDLIAGMTQLAERAHRRGMKAFVATQLPFRDANSIPGIFSPEKDAKRRALNEWIRSSHVFDGVIDFDKATRDPSDPKKFLAAYDSCDHLHPNDAGYKAMAESIDPALFKLGGAAPRTSSSR